MKRKLSPANPLFSAILLFFVLIPALSLRAEDQFFDSNGVKIHYIIQGEGEPVLLIHGFSANIQLQWGLPGVIGTLSKDYRVIALDNRGHGQSDKPRDPEAYGVQMVEDSIRLLDHLHIKKAHVIGYSMGGFITLKMLTLHPDRMITATLGGAGWGKTMQENPERMKLMDTLADSLDRGDGIGPLIDALTPEGEPKKTPEQLKSMNAMMTGMNDQKALAAAVRSFKAFNETEEEVRAIKVPTLAIIGDKDTLKPTADALVGVLPGLQLIVIKDANHMTAFNRPEFNQGLGDFLAAHRTAAKPKPVAIPVAAK